jgi:DNA topoisomerase-1
LAANKYKALVIVESPAKAKKIGQYLGSKYKVLASFGHVRDLPAKAAEVPKELKKESWATLGVRVNDDFEPLYVIPSDKKKIVKELKDNLKVSDELIIATDEDREGESIGWHLIQLLKPKVPIKRMVFSEITKAAILEAIENTRDLDENLVSAQETRRVLDRLYGYTLSPLLWKKIARGLSAGRVQSVAVRVLVQRELERLAFRKGTYWDLKAELEVPQQGSFEAQLVTVEGKRVASGKDFDENTGQLKVDKNGKTVDVRLLDENAAKQLLDQIRNGDWTVESIEDRQQTRKPSPPFTTSTMQQESNRKLNMTARQTMQTAQRLYEDGHITYMRTDSVSLSKEAIDAARNTVQKRYGDNYVHDTVRQFTGKSKNAQEAHEAIRPAGTEMKTAEELNLSGPQAKLYELIWKRTVATQMAEAKLTFQSVIIKAGESEFRASGRHVDFPGFFRAYVEGSDDPEAALDDTESALPKMSENDKLNCKEADAVPHETKPPARYTEATLVKTLEAEGVGRPSTYASIIGTVQDRGYVRKSGSQLVPTFTALAVTRLLEDYFPNLVNLQFTAQMEQTLDDISMGQADRLPYLKGFYSGDQGLENQVKTREEDIDPRKACTLRFEGVDPDVRVGKYGPYLETFENDEPITASLPADIAPADVDNEVALKLIALKKEGPKSLGVHPEEGLPIFVQHGPFGPYLQLGEVTEEHPKPKRVSIPKNYDPSELEFDTAVQLLNLPRRLGHHPETNLVVNAGIGRFGPYVLSNKKYKSLAKEDNILTIELDRAVELLAQAKQRGAAEPIKVLGKHPDDESDVGIYEGRYGAYVKHGKINATIPKDKEMDQVTLEEALVWIAEKAEKKGVKTKKKKAAKKKKKTTKKKKATKKKKSAKKKKTTKKSDSEE